MKTNFFIFKGFAFLFCFGFLAQNTLAQQSVFWEIKSPYSAKSSYLFGTHHLINYQFINKNDEILDDLQHVDIMIGEIDLNQTGMSSFMSMGKAMLLTESSLDKLLKAEDYAYIDTQMKENIGIGLSFFNKFKPIAIYQLLLVIKMMKSEEKPEKNGGESPITKGSMDVFFQNKAKEFQKQVKGLETFDEQVNILYGQYTMDRQIEMLLDLVYQKGDENNPDELQQKLNTLYRSQDLEKIYEYMIQSTSEEEMTFLLNDRNLRWIPQIKQLLESGKSLFIAVGAGHLPGKNGLLKLLEREGYEIKSIQINVE